MCIRDSAWACTQFLSHDALRLPEGTVPATPEALVDPITVFMKPRPAPQASNGS